MAEGIAINGRVLAELRKLRAMSQQGLADACRAHAQGVDLTQAVVSLYEQEGRSPSAAVLACVRAVLGLSGEEMAALVRTPTLDSTYRRASEEDDTDRATFLHRIGAAAALAAVGAPPVPPQPPTLNDELYRLYASTSPAALRPHARLNAAISPTHDARCLAGWLAWLVDDRGGAVRCFRAALRQAADGRERAQALASLSSALRGEAESLALAQQAREEGRGADGRTRCFVELRIGAECALNDGSAPSHAVMGRAEDLLDGLDHGEDSGFFSPAGRFAGWNAAYLAGARAEARVRLGDGRRALEDLREAEASAADTSP